MEKIGKLLIQCVIPVIIAMIVSPPYNMVDSIFIGHGVGTMAIPGLALTFPPINLTAASSSLVGVGAAILISVKLGQRDYDTVWWVLENVFILNPAIGISFTVTALPLLDPIFYLFRGSNKAVKYAREFMQVILLGNVVTHLYLELNIVFRVSGHPQKAVMATIMTVITNVPLAPLLIFVFDWEIHGAATATVYAQLIALIWQFHLFYRKDKPVRLKKGIFRSKRRIALDSLATGISPSLMNMVSCSIVALINQGLKKHRGNLTIGAFGIVNRIVSAFIMVVLGLSQGMQSITGYNFGAKLYPRVTEVPKVTICCATVVTTTDLLIGMLTPKVVSSIFASGEELISIASRDFRVVVFLYPIVGFRMVASSFFQSIGMASRAIFLSLTWQMLFLAPCLLTLPHYYGQMGIWASMPVADLTANLISGGMLWWQFRQFKKVTV